MKALVGSWETRPYRLLAEVTALRGRVRELEDALARVTEENTVLRDQQAALSERDDADLLITR